MTELNEELNEESLTTENLDETIEDVLNITGQKIDVLSDGTEILRGDEFEEEEEEEEISDENIRKLAAFTTGQKNMTDEEINTLRNDQFELERLLKIASIKSKHFTYAPKKKFNAAYKSKRKFKNTQAKKSRAINRR